MMMLQMPVQHSVATSAAPGLLSRSSFGADLTVPATILFMVVVACIVILMARRRDKGRKRGFPEIYHEELDAMRKRNREEQR